MNDEKVESIIREYIPQIVHMSLATSRDNKPWVCEVHFAWDDDLNLYFVSSTDRRHSQEIEQNPHVAGNIVTQHHRAQQVRGVYFEGTAKSLTDHDEIERALSYYVGRFSERSGLRDEVIEAVNSRIYMITPEKLYLFDTYEKPSAKYELDWVNRSSEGSGA